MNEKEMQFILQEGEGLNIEFKESYDAKHFAREVVAFANSSGGRIFCGVTDKKEVNGVEITNKLKSEIQDLAHNCEPSIKIVLEVVKFEKKEILAVIVPEGDNKPYLCSSGFFLRQGANSQKLTREEIIDLFTHNTKVRFDSLFNENFSFPEDFDIVKYDNFIKKSGLSFSNPIEITLSNLSLGKYTNKKFQLNNAGILFFAKYPEKFFRQNFVTCVLYKGKERVHILDRKDFSGDLLFIYDSVVAFMLQHLKLEYIIQGTGPRKEVLELPEEAIREALINAIIHRDYFDERVGVFVEIFDDRVEIVNKGKLLFNIEKLGTISFPRNPLIFDIFYRLKLIEKVGSGINRIKKMVAERKMSVKFNADDFFKVIFYRKFEPLSEPLSEPLKRVYDFICTHERVNGVELAKELVLSRATITRYLSVLKGKKLIKYVGSKKWGYYQVEKINKAL